MLPVFGVSAWVLGMLLGFWVCRFSFSDVFVALPLCCCFGIGFLFYESSFLTLTLCIQKSAINFVFPSASSFSTYDFLFLFQGKVKW